MQKLFQRQDFCLSHDDARHAERNTPMTKQPKNEALTTQELREALLSELESSHKVIAELSDEQLEAVAGGMINPFSVTREEYINWFQRHARWVAENPQARSHLLGSGNPMARHSDQKP
jgi:hypothetical protein